MSIKEKLAEADKRIATFRPDPKSYDENIIIYLRNLVKACINVATGEEDPRAFLRLAAAELKKIEGKP